ncbi:MAG: hypothetical protein EBS09_08515 [Flavobacteriia bacterium]|nr:hypothetical protein [Flavobacteriia bacterium]
MDESSYSLRSFAPFFSFSHQSMLCSKQKKQLPKGAAFIRVESIDIFSNQFIDDLNQLNLLYKSINEYS